MPDTDENQAQPSTGTETAPTDPPVPTLAPAAKEQPVKSAPVAAPAEEPALYRIEKWSEEDNYVCNYKREGVHPYTCPFATLDEDEMLSHVDKPHPGQRMDAFGNLLPD